MAFKTHTATKEPTKDFGTDQKDPLAGRAETVEPLRVEPAKISQADNVKPGGEEPVHQTGTDVATYSYGEDEGAGFEGVSKADFLTPILDIIQSGSPEIQNNTEGAKVGHFVIRALGLILDGQKGIKFIPCGRDHVINEWWPRGGEKGGLNATHRPDDPKMIEAKKKKPFGKIVTQQGTELVETYYLFGFIVLDEGDVIRVSVPFWSTKINNYRSLMTMADGCTALNTKTNKRDKMPLFAHFYTLKTRFIEKKGFKWHGYAAITWFNRTAVESRVPPMDPIYDEARAFSKQIAQGLVKADMATAAPQDDPETHGGDGGGQGSNVGGKDAEGNEIPF